jgi:predicted transcriptional regulator
MGRHPTPRPTDGELAILEVLWRRGPCTVREVHDELPGETAYTTALKMMQIMADKDLVTRDTSSRSHVYTAALDQERTQRWLATDLVDRAFGGSAAQLAMQALSAKSASSEELAEIRRLLDALEDGDEGSER